MNGKVLHRHGYETRFVITGFRREVDENCALLGYYAASSGNSLTTFRDNLSVPLKMGPIGCLVTPVRNCHYTLHNSPEESISREKFRSVIVGGQLAI